LHSTNARKNCIFVGLLVYPSLLAANKERKSMGIKLTVFFEDPFWVGVFERVSDGYLETAKVTFGAEPKDPEVYGYIRDHLHELSFSRPIEIKSLPAVKINPKRLQRVIWKEVAETGVGTKAQQALKKEMETRKADCRSAAKERRENREAEKFQKRQAKKKERKKGR
jgi:hypothetical protein